MALTPKSGRILSHSCVCACMNLCAPCMYMCPQRSEECQDPPELELCVRWETKLDPLLRAGSALNPLSIFPSLHWLPFETLILLQCYCGHSRGKRMEARSTYISGGKTNKQKPPKPRVWWEWCTREAVLLGAVHTWALFWDGSCAHLSLTPLPSQCKAQGDD